MSRRLYCGATACWLAAVCGLVASIPVQAEDPADLLTVLLARHRAARQSIHSFSATVTMQRTFPEKMTWFTAKYWRSFDVVRVEQEEPGGALSDFLLKDSEIRSVGRPRAGAKGEALGAARKAPTELFCKADVWRIMLIDCGGPTGGQYDLDSFLQLARTTPQVQRARLEGRDCVRMTAIFDRPDSKDRPLHATLWYDVGYNYLVRKQVGTREYEDGSDWRGEAEILEFVEVRPGIFFPTKCRMQSSRSGKLVSVDETTLANVRINEAIPPNVFELPAIPRGTILSDHIAGTRYAIDANWNQIGAAEPLPKAFVASPGDAPGGQRSQSSREPMPSSRWLLLVSLVVFGLAGACWLYRRYRAQAE